MTNEELTARIEAIMSNIQDKVPANRIKTLIRELLYDYGEGRIAWQSKVIAQAIWKPKENHD